jgi:hypothetical protein
LCPQREHVEEADVLAAEPLVRAHDPLGAVAVGPEGDDRGVGAEVDG